MSSLPGAAAWEQYAELLAASLRAASSVLVITGAGVSAESGLPTFRGTGGLWDGEPVEAVATPAAFARDPERVWRFYHARRRAVLRAKPNAAHLALAALEARVGHFLLVTQNVDDLHERAGSTALVKLHGNLLEDLCTACSTITPAPPVPPAAGGVPRCTCGGLLRPNVVWFGEWLRQNDLRRLERFLLRSRWSDPRGVALVVGTSGTVSGGYGLVEAARDAGAVVVEVNPESTALSGCCDLCIRARAAEALSKVVARLEQD